ncbi:unnamed protein product [Rotaria sordida]|uniref:Uncharacterized protein n=1 Tax=Rotaria sordida TaxID=392033 RepID=A0A820GGF5_9BILA|nr:unnamed protein product [Rotaria sordida]CAF4278752.1 unnamed protein product [Rotaria sordida]
MSKMNSTSSIVNQSVLENKVNLISTSNREFKPKGILKQSKNYSYPGLINQMWNRYTRFQCSQSYLNTCDKKNDNENSNDSISVINDNNSLPSTSSTSISVKRVTFNDVIYEKKFKPSKSMPIITKYSRSQQRNSQNLHLMNTTEVNSDEENSIDKVQLNPTNWLQFEELDIYESSDDELIYDD